MRRPPPNPSSRPLPILHTAPPAEEALQFLAHTLTNKLLHTPSTRLREASSAGETELLQAADQLFRPRPVSPGNRT